MAAPMERYRRVAVSLWSRDEFCALSLGAQHLYLHLVTSPISTSVPGLLALGELQLARALGYDLATLRPLWAELEEAGLARADWAARVVWLPLQVDSEQPTNPDQIIGWGKHLSQLQPCGLLLDAMAHLRRSLGGKPLSMREALERVDPYRGGLREPVESLSRGCREGVRDERAAGVQPVESLSRACREPVVEPQRRRPKRPEKPIVVLTKEAVREPVREPVESLSRGCREGVLHQDQDQDQDQDQEHLRSLPLPPLDGKPDSLSDSLSRACPDAAPPLMRRMASEGGVSYEARAQLQAPSEPQPSERQVRDARRYLARRLGWDEDPEGVAVPADVASEVARSGLRGERYLAWSASRAGGGAPA